MGDRQEISDLQKNKMLGYLKVIFYIVGGIIVLTVTCVPKFYRKERMAENREKYLAGYYDNMNGSGQVNTTSMFIPPPNWINYDIANTFTISVPPTVELRHESDLYSQGIKDINKTGSDIIVFQQKGLSQQTQEAFSTYCRIMIDVEKGSKDDFIKATKYEELTLDEIRFFQDQANLSSAKYKIIGTPKVRYIKLESIYGIELEYLREGEENKQTHVSTYYLFNYDEYATITLSYRYEDASIWEIDFSNVIRTFRWNIVK
jgi:hypothetical protein